MVKKAGDKEEKPKMKCPKCGHKWVNRAKEPKECPCCKTRLDYLTWYAGTGRGKE